MREGEGGRSKLHKKPAKNALEEEPPPRDEDEDDGSGKDYYATGTASFGADFGLIWGSAVCASKC